MNFGLDFFRSENLFDNSLLIDQISCSQSANSATSARHFLTPTAESLQKRSVGVGNERKFQAITIGKLLLKSLFILAYAYDIVTCRRQFSFVSLKRASLSRTTACVCLRIRIKYNFATAIVTTFNLASVLVNAKNLRNFISNRHSVSIMCLVLLTIDVCILTRAGTLMQSLYMHLFCRKPLDLQSKQPP